VHTDTTRSARSAARRSQPTNGSAPDIPVAASPPGTSRVPIDPDSGNGTPATNCRPLSPRTGPGRSAASVTR
jgi:hypothetical protein